jgi:cellobiose-specific phosphotransferase system component IIC
MKLMACARLYATAIVLGLWAVLWALGIQGNVVIGIGLAATALSAVVAERERVRRRRERRSG